MGKHCAAYGCSNQSSKCSGISFFKFPNDFVLKKRWSNAMKRKGFNPTKNSYVCSVHFKDTDFELGVIGWRGKTNETKRLKRDAVPVITISNDTSNKPPEKKPRRILKRDQSSESTERIPPICLEDGLPCCESESWKNEPIKSQMCRKCALSMNTNRIRGKGH